jgi:hypothetical protein
MSARLPDARREYRTVTGPKAASSNYLLRLVALPRFAAARPTFVFLFLLRAWRAKFARAALAFLVAIGSSSLFGGKPSRNGWPTAPQPPSATD